MQQVDSKKTDNIRHERKSKFLSLTEKGRDELLERNRKLRQAERKAFIKAYFASDMRYNIK